MSKEYITYKTGNNHERKIRKRNKAYRQKVMVFKFICTIFAVFVLFLAITHIFTHKRKYRNEGIEAYNQGDYEMAVEYFDKSLAEKQWFSENVDVDLLMYKASAFLRLGRFEEAGRIYDSLVADYSDEYYYKEDVLFLSEVCKALVIYQQGNYTDSITVLKQACEKGYTDISIYVAVCCENMGAYEDMKSYLDMYSGPRDAYLYYKYACCYIHMGDYASAAEATKNGLSYNDANLQQTLSYLQIMCYYKLGDFENSYALCDAYLLSYPEDEKGKKIHDFLESRVNPDEEVINDIFGVNGLEESSN